MFTHSGQNNLIGDNVNLGKPSCPHQPRKQPSIIQKTPKLSPPECNYGNCLPQYQSVWPSQVSIPRIRANSSAHSFAMSIDKNCQLPRSLHESTASSNPNRWPTQKLAVKSERVRAGKVSSGFTAGPTVK